MLPRSMRFGTVALVGRTNVGKSTFLNAVLGAELAIISERPQTTRDTLLGVVHEKHAQLAFLDTPGFHRPRNELGRRMNAAAIQAAQSADVHLFITDRHEVTAARAPNEAARPPDNAAPSLFPADRELLELTTSAAPCIVAINKVDRLGDKSQLLPVLQAFAAYRPFTAIIPTCLLHPPDVRRVLDEIVRCLPEGPPEYSDDTLTDRPVSFFVREYVREQALRCAAREVPHAVAVSIDSIESSRRLLVAKATIHVEKSGQRKILVGRNGDRIRQIGIGARERLEQLLGYKVHLSLFVRVSPRWKNMPRQLAELGYAALEPTAAPTRSARPRKGSQRRPS